MVDKNSKHMFILYYYYIYFSSFFSLNISHIYNSFELFSLHSLPCLSFPVSIHPLSIPSPSFFKPMSLWLVLRPIKILYIHEYHVTFLHTYKNCNVSISLKICVP